MIRSDFLDVRAFHVKFGLPVDDGSAPVLAEPHIWDYRLRFLDEERTEYIEAYQARNLVKATDALIDLVYVIFGTALFLRAAAPVLATQPVFIDPWPSFERVKHYASTRGFLIARSAQLLPYPTYDVLEKALYHDLRMAKISHFNREVAFVLAHLSSAASRAYLTAALMNVPWPACWRHVQAANMSKIRAPSADASKRGSTWDVIKPGGWQPPDPMIRAELMKAGGQV